MKFTSEILGNLGSRLGHISLNKAELSDITLTTPLWLMYTKAGSIPHLTHDVQEIVSKKVAPVHFTLNTLVESHEAVKEFQKGIASFVGYENQISYLSIQDPAVNTPSGYNTNKTTSVWTQGGRIQLNVEKFMDIQEAFAPDWYQALCDSDTDSKTTRKRIRKSVDRSLLYLDECLGKHLKSERLKHSSIFGSIEGGYDVEERTRSAKETALRPVAGFVIEGFTNYGPDNNNRNFEEIIKLLPEVLKLLPAEKPRIMHGVWKPDEALKLIELGVDILDLSYPYICTEGGIALTFKLNFKDTKINEICQSKASDVDHQFGINLNDKQYFEDFSALLEGCECYTCRQFTRSYIHHLLCTSELLAYVLLIMHNLHHYEKFNDVIHDALKLDQLDRLKTAVLNFAP